MFSHRAGRSYAEPGHVQHASSTVCHFVLRLSPFLDPQDGSSISRSQVYRAQRQKRGFLHLVALFRLRNLPRSPPTDFFFASRLGRGGRQP